MILDGQISRALGVPSVFEEAMWRTAALESRRDVEQAIDCMSSHRLRDSLLETAEHEVRRCMSAPCVMAGIAIPTELSRLEYYIARNHFSWLRADARAEAASKVTAFGDKVATVAEGALVANARAVSSSHSFAQANSPNQVAAIATAAAFNNRESAVFAGGQFYQSSIAASNWAFDHSGSGASVWTVFRSTTNGAIRCLWSSDAGGSSQGSQLFLTATTSNLRWTLSATGVNIIDTTDTTGAVVNTATYAEADFLDAGSPQFSRYRGTTSVATGSRTGAPVATASSFPMVVGATGQAVPAFFWTGDIVDILFANQVNATLRTLNQRYLLLRYVLS